MSSDPSWTQPPPFNVGRTERQLVKIKLRCSHAQFHDIHHALNKVRSTSETVSVSKKGLRALLMDHADLLKFAQDFARSNSTLTLEGDQ